MTGTGTIGDPFIISTATDLNDVRLNMSQSVYYQLGANIDLSSYSSWTPIGTTTNEFKGHFDGNNFTISNMTITTSQQTQVANSIGLFGTIIIPSEVSQSYAVKNLTLQSCSINLNNWTIGTPALHNGKLYLGLLVGLWDDYSTHSGEDKSVWNKIEYVKIKNSSINIIKSNLTGSVSESLSLFYLGGLIGGASYGLITSCSVDDIRIEGIVSSSVASPAVYVGGLVNFYYQITYCTVKNSFINFECKVNSGSFDTHAPQMFIYAFAGAGTETEVHDNYVYNTVVSGALNVHGFSDTILVDENALFDLGHNFPSGKKYTNATFGNTPVSSVYLFNENYTEWDASASLYNYVQSGSNIYNINDVTPTGMPTITELTVAQMKNSASYVGFDFQNVWNISPNSQSGYPYFGWETVDYTPSGPVSYDILTILTPNGGERYKFGNTVPITWSVTQSYELVIQGFVP